MAHGMNESRHRTDDVDAWMDVYTRHSLYETSLDYIDICVDWIYLSGLFWGSLFPVHLSSLAGYMGCWLTPDNRHHHFLNVLYI